jgi:hypothetical protein
MTASKAQLRRIKMIIAFCFDYYILRTPLAMIFIMNVNFNNKIYGCFYAYGNAAYALSYFLKFFIYYFYNKKFKKYTKLTLSLK